MGGACSAATLRTPDRRSENASHIRAAAPIYDNDARLAQATVIYATGEARLIPLSYGKPGSDSAALVQQRPKSTPVKGNSAPQWYEVLRQRLTPNAAGSGFSIHESRESCVRRNTLEEPCLTCSKTPARSQHYRCHHGGDAKNGRNQNRDRERTNLRECVWVSGV